MKLFTPLFAVCCLVLGLHSISAQDKTKPAAKPNVIFILVDDMGWGDLQANHTQQQLNGRQVNYEHSIKTPALSAMAKEGIQLRRHYSAAPVCAPARASLLLGVHQGHSRVVRNNQFDHPIEDSHTLGSIMQQAGYTTAAIGKWGVGGAGQSKTPLSAAPHQRGFDYFYGLLDHLAGHFHYPAESRDLFEYDNTAPNPAWCNIKNQVPKTAYSTDLFTARAKQWIIDHRKAHGGTNKPFFLYLAYPAPHASLAVPAVPYPRGGGRKGGLQWVKQGNQESANTAFDPQAQSKKDSFIHPDNARFNNEVAKRHATMIRRVDESVADIVRLLKDLKIDDNTLIVFTSDNGPHNEPGADGKHNHGAQNPQFFRSYGMMDGIKRDCWEGGMRVPTIVRWPARIPNGQISMQAGQFHDWLATLADLAGVPIPARSDGVSLLPTLTGKGEQMPGVIYSEYQSAHNAPGFTPKNPDFLPQHRGNTRGQQQLIFAQGLKGLRRNVQQASHPFMIFDTLQDPQEGTDLASRHRDLQTALHAAAMSNRRATASCPTIFDTALVPAIAATAETKTAGLHRAVYQGPFPWVPHFKHSRLQPVAQDTVRGVQVEGKGPQQRGVELGGYINVPADGAYTFYLQTDSNPGSKAYVRLHNMELIDADKNYTPGTEANSDLGSATAIPVYLSKGLHPIHIAYISKSGNNSHLTLQWQGPGIPKQRIPDSAFYHDGKP